MIFVRSYQYFILHNTYHYTDVAWRSANLLFLTYTANNKHIFAGPNDIQSIQPYNMPIVLDGSFNIDFKLTSTNLLTQMITKVLQTYTSANILNGNKLWQQGKVIHHHDVIMSTMAYQMNSLTIDYSTVYSGAGQRKHQNSASLAFVWGIHRWPVNSLHKRPVTRKMFPFDDVIMRSINRC